jgi:hypothetical protein
MSDKHLAIEISNQTVRFNALRKDLVLHHASGELKGKTDADRKSALDQIYNATSFLKDDYDNITLAWCNERSTIVPNTIFNESSAKDIFQLCFGKDTLTQEIDYNRIAELSVINVYEIPDWIKSFFVIKYPSIVMQHAGSHLVRKSLSENAFYLKASIVCFESYFRLTLVKHNALEFYSSFSYQSAEDIIYHLNFALQQKEMVNEKGKIEIISSIGTTSGLSEEIEKGLNRIQELKQMEIVKDDHHLAKSQLLCV